MPVEFRPARAFLVNVPAANGLALGAATPCRTRPPTEILALWRRCPHLGCMIPPACEERSRFQCFCHQSTYNILGEKLLLGPAPRGMDRFPVRFDAEGTLIIDTREVINGPPKGCSPSPMHTRPTSAARERSDDVELEDRLVCARSARSRAAQVERLVVLR